MASDTMRRDVPDEGTRYEALKTQEAPLPSRQERGFRVPTSASDVPSAGREGVLANRGNGCADR
ncbi:MAG: hypothetical protein EBZ89_04405, partial [Chloroflexi bacterium]|nr:hypothetical protein [Chloroflexota bacterium]